jgi:FtsP/CotA-like multicopper oxidase with cupredoxin domain
MKKLLLAISILITNILFVNAQNPLAIPPILSGDTINLILQEGQINYFTSPTNTFGVNGNILGPTLILEKNQQITVNITNNLPEFSTIHWHGMHVSPTVDGGPHIVINPGETWSPSFEVLDHASTYWYHPHPHHMTNNHVIKGMAGFVIVKDDEEVALNLPREYGIDDIPLAVQTKEFDSNFQFVVGGALDSFLVVNGTYKPYVELPAQMVRLRLLNGATERAFNFGLSNGATFYQIASDGGLLTSPVALTRLRLTPGERAEIIVDLTGMEGGTLNLMSYGAELPSAIYGASQPGMGFGQTIPNYTSNHLNGSNFIVLKINVLEPNSNAISSLPTNLTTHTPFLEADTNAQRILTFMSTVMGQNALLGPFMINDTHFDMDVINYEIPFNNIEVWELRNNSPIGHPFHIHDVQFYVLSINGAVPPLNHRGRKDVVFVPAGGSVVRIITKFETFCNDSMPYMYHCHMLTHEDDGMMGQFVVKCPAAGLEINNKIKNLTTVFPNPVSKYSLLHWDGDFKNLKLQNMLGATVLEFAIENANSLHLQKYNLKTGVYNLMLENENSTSNLKIVITD